MTETICKDCVFCIPLVHPSGTRDAAAGRCKRYKDTGSLVGIKECDGFRSFEYLERPPEPEPMVADLIRQECDALRDMLLRRMQEAGA